MENKLNIKACKSCGALVKVIEDCKCDGCGIQCCGKEMETLIPNSVDASSEKHIPTYEKVENKILVKVNHPMEQEHYITSIIFVNGNKEKTITLHPGESAEAKFKYIPGSTIYAYCNKHGLWKIDVQ